MEEYPKIERRKQMIQCALHEKMLEDMRNDLKEIKEILTGNSDPQKGIAFRLNAVESWNNGASKIAWVLALGAISGFVGLTWKIIDAYYRGQL